MDKLQKQKNELAWKYYSRPYSQCCWKQQLAIIQRVEEAKSKLDYMEEAKKQSMRRAAGDDYSLGGPVYDSTGRAR